MARAVFVVEQRGSVLGRPLLADPDQVLHTTLEVPPSAGQAKNNTENDLRWINELNPYKANVKTILNCKKVRRLKRIMRF